MKICACVAEYNPLHSGHLKHIGYIKNVLGCDKLIVVMSGNFTQRGEPAVMNKYLRAVHAVKSGADAVIELPAVFAAANAEIFASGAVKIIDSLGIADVMCFGAESGDKESFLNTARAMLDESKAFKQELKKQLSTGLSLAAAKLNTVKKLNDGAFDERLLSTPNNILGVEYTKALIRLNSAVEIEPMLRDGDHNDDKLKKETTSATSIRTALKNGNVRAVKKYVPRYVFDDLKRGAPDFDKIIMSAMIRESAEETGKISDCSEGLENRIKALIKDAFSYGKAVEKITTKRYTSSRIRRIFVNNLLGIKASDARTALSAKAYGKVLAVSESAKPLLSEISRNGKIKLITRKSDADALDKTQKEIFGFDVKANDLYNLAANEKSNEYLMITV